MSRKGQQQVGLFIFALVVFLAVVGILIYLFPTTSPTSEVNVTEICISKCLKLKETGKDLSNGPCLLNPIPSAPDWVCDVAHWPRQEVDNLPENQCSAYREGKATKFVEVTPDCKLIRVYPPPSEHIFIKIRKWLHSSFGKILEDVKGFLGLK